MGDNKRNDGSGNMRRKSSRINRPPQYRPKSPSFRTGSSSGGGGSSSRTATSSGSGSSASSARRRPQPPQLSTNINSGTSGSASATAAAAAGPSKAFKTIFKSIQKLTGLKMIQKNIKLPPVATVTVEQPTTAASSSGEMSERTRRTRKSRSRRSSMSSLASQRNVSMDSATVAAAALIPATGAGPFKSFEEKSFTLRSKISDSFSNRQTINKLTGGTTGGFKLKTGSIVGGSYTIGAGVGSAGGNFIGGHHQQPIGSIFAIKYQKCQAEDSALHLLAMTARATHDDRIRKEETVTFVPGKGELRNVTTLDDLQQQQQQPEQDGTADNQSEQQQS